MKFTKTETVKVFKIHYDENEFELVAAKNKEMAQRYLYDVYEDVNYAESFKITEVGENKLKKEVGISSIEAKYPRKCTAYDALEKAYKRCQMPFVFWTNVL